MNNEEHKDQWERLHDGVRSHLLRCIESGEADDKMVAQALRYLKEHKPEESLDDSVKNMNRKDAREATAASLPFKKAE